MKGTNIHPQSPAILGRFRTAVSLHSHTLHSEETLFFIHRLAARFRLVRAVLERGKARYQAAHGSALDLNRAWWTPPLAAYDAWRLERNQIENGFGLAPLVSLTDHDNVEASLALRVLHEARHLPVSVEWTVPHGPISCKRLSATVKLWLSSIIPAGTKTTSAGNTTSHGL